MADEKKGALRAAVAMLFERMQWARQAGITFAGKRDLYEAFGYDRILSVAQYRERYERGGIAGRIVDALPKATWRGGVQVVEDHDSDRDTPFEAAWKEFDKRTQAVPRLMQADILGRLSTFSALLIGAAGSVETELPRGDGKSAKAIRYLRAYVGAGGPNSRRTANDGQSITLADAVIDSFETDIKSPRFGKPRGYRVRIPTMDAADLTTRVVHWSRVVHVAEGLLDDEVYGEPALRRPWNLLDDLDKVTGGGSEAFFQRVHGGRLWNLDKEIKALGDQEKKDFVEAIEAFQHGITRDVRLRGVSVQDLGSSVTSFGNDADALLTQIAGTTAIPKRILTGSEMGELASSQDRENWRDQVNGRRENYAGPFILTALVDRLIEYGHLPKPETYEPVWGAVLNLTEDEKQRGAQAWATTNRVYGSTVFTDDEIRKTWYGKEALPPELKKPVAAPQTPDANVIDASLKTASESRFASVLRDLAGDDETARLVDELTTAMLAEDDAAIAALLEEAGE